MYKAKPGERWGNKEQYGKDAEDLILQVPLGTLVRQTKTGAIVGQVTEEGEQLLLVKGGKWWVGNMHFVTPQIQYPEMALYGEPGHSLWLTLELQLLADVALVGMPSVGKSSLINAVSNVKAKTAEYHFTTLIPNVGVVEHKKKSFVLIDIPGLIQGASDGKGLGSEFLRHILKSRALCFMLDANKFEQGRKDFDILFLELKNYILSKYKDASVNLVQQEKLIIMEVRDEEGEMLFSKAIYWIINKKDTLWDEELIQEYMDGRYNHVIKTLAEHDLKVKGTMLKNLTTVLSAATRQWIEPWLDQMIWIVDNDSLMSTIVYEPVAIQKQVKESIKDITESILPELLEQWYLPEGQDHSKKKVREVNHSQVSYLSNIVPRWNDQAEMRYRRQLDQQGLLWWMSHAWVKKWDILKVISWYHGVKDQFILRE